MRRFIVGLHRNILGSETGHFNWIMVYCWDMKSGSNARINIENEDRELYFRVGEFGG